MPAFIERRASRPAVCHPVTAISPETACEPKHPAAFSAIGPHALTKASMPDDLEPWHHRHVCHPSRSRGGAAGGDWRRGRSVYSGAFSNELRRCISCENARLAAPRKG
jgi:hypothetical protein